MTAEEVEQLPFPVALQFNRQMDVRPVKPGHHTVACIAEQFAGDVVSGGAVGGRGHGGDRGFREDFAQLRQGFIFRAEGRAPL